jgi:hypothetical protein
MSHLIIKNIDKVFTPAGEYAKTWTGLETIVEPSIALDGANIMDAFCPIVECGLKADFEAEICTIDAELQGELDLTTYKLVLADCRKGYSGKVHPLHVPKQGYKIHQNKALFDCMIAAAQAVLGANGFEIVTVGTLGGYSQFFMSIAIKGQDTFNVGKLANGALDTWRKFFNLNSSHNGLIGSNRMLSGIRMVCMNTVQMSIHDATEAGNISVIKHTENSEALITPEHFEADLAQWLSRADTFEKMLAAMKSTPMNLDAFKSFACGVFTNSKTDLLSDISFNRVDEMADLFSKGIGNDGASVYDALNAFTEYFTHGGKDSKLDKAKRVAMANFGRGNDWKNEAMAVAKDRELLAATITRGETLLNDKLLAIAKRAKKK